MTESGMQGSGHGLASYVNPKVPGEWINSEMLTDIKISLRKFCCATGHSMKR